MAPELSIVIPVYNEEDVLPLLAARLRPVADGLGATYEVITVDDGSDDLSPAVLQRLMRDWPQLRIVRLRANAGHQAAISAGLASARGDYVVTLDADLQDPPEVIPEMLAQARAQRVDVVYGVRSDRSSDSAFKRLSAKAFYRLIRVLSGTHAQVDAGDYRLMSRATVNAINSLPEHHRVLRFVVPALGFPSTSVTYRRDERAAGSSKYPLSKMIRLSLDSVTGLLHRSPARRHLAGPARRPRGAGPARVRAGRRLPGPHPPGLDVHGRGGCRRGGGAAAVRRDPRRVRRTDVRAPAGPTDLLRRLRLAHGAGHRRGRARTISVTPGIAFSGR